MVGQVSYFVEKQRTLFGSLELTCPVGVCISERPFYMSEKLTRIKIRWWFPYPQQSFLYICGWKAHGFPRASISFPVPFSPVIKRLASVTATFSIKARSCCITLLSPQYIGEWTGFSLLAVFLSLCVEVAAVCSVSTSFWLSQGLTIKSVAPSLIPRIASSISA